MLNIVPEDFTNSSEYYDHKGIIASPGYFSNGNYICPTYQTKVYRTTTNVSRVVEWSNKPDPVKSDFRSATSWTSGGMKLLSSKSIYESIYSDNPGNCDPQVPGSTVISRDITHGGLRPINHEGVSMHPTSQDLPAIELPADKRIILDNNLLDKISSQKLQAGVALAEASKTTSFLSDTLTRTMTSLLAIRQGDYKRALRAVSGYKPTHVTRGTKVRDNLHKIADVSSSNLLQYRYALSPLLADIFGSYDLLINGTDWRLSCRSRTSWTTPYGNAFAHAKLIYALSDSGGDLFRRLSDSVGLGALTGATAGQILWELTPWSFLVDQVVNIGQVLQLATASQGLIFIDGYRSVYYTGTLSDSKEEFSYRNGYIAAKNMIDHRQSYYGFCRTKLGGFPSPSLEISNPLNLYNVATVASLGYQLKKPGFNFKTLR